MKRLLAYLFIFLGLGLTFNVNAEAEEKNDIIFCDQYHTVQITREISNCEIWGGKLISEKQYVEAFLNAINNSSKYRLLNKYTKNELKNTLISNVKKYNLDKSLLPKNLLNIKTQITIEESSQTQKITKEVKSSNQDWRKEFELIQNKKKSIKTQKVIKKNINEVHFCKKRESFPGMEPVFLSSYYKNKLVGCDNHIQISDNQYINEILSYRMNAASTMWNSSFFKLSIARNIVKEFNELDLNTKYLREVLQSEYGYYKAQLKQKNLIANKDPTVKPKKKTKIANVVKKSEYPTQASNSTYTCGGKDWLGNTICGEDWEKKQNNQITKTEPSQTQKVVRKTDNYSNYQFCSSYVNATRYFIQKKGKPTFSDSSAGADISNKAFYKKRCEKEYSLDEFINLFLYRGKIDNPTDTKLKNNLNSLYSEFNRENLDLSVVNNIIKNSPKLYNYLNLIKNKPTQIAKIEPTVEPKKKVKVAKVEDSTQEEFKPKKTNQDNEAPVITIAEAITVNDSSYEFKGKVTDKAKTIYVEVDGRSVDVKKGQFVVKGYSPIDKEISITAFDQWGNRSEPKIVKLTIDIKDTNVADMFEALDPSKIRSKSNKNRVALIIGIEKYDQTPDATFANLDAQYFYEYARKGFGISKSNIKLLVDEDANLIQSLGTLSKWLPGKIKSGETELIIFFAGHGLASNDGKELYLLPQDSDPDLLARTALSRTELFKEIIALNPKSVTMFLDTCYSGVSRDEKTLLASARPVRIIADEQDTPNNFTIFSASQLEQISSGFKEAKHGIFSYYLMKGLEGKADANNDKDITNGELLAYMDQNVAQRASELGRQQNPSLAGDPDKILMSYR